MKKFICSICKKIFEYKDEERFDLKNEIIKNKCHTLKTLEDAGYGSEFHGKKLTIHLCDGCAVENCD